MNKKVIKRIKNIHELSKKYNSGLDKSHDSCLLGLMQEHIDQIKELKEKKDNHFLTETGDLIVLCFELLLENDISLNAKVNECLERFEKKISYLIKEKENS